MESKSKTRTEYILTALHVIAWIAFIGMLIRAGALVVAYLVSLKNMDAAKNLYDGLDLSNLAQYNFWYYTGSVSFIFVLSLMKASVVYMAITILSTVKITNPFTPQVAQKIEQVSYLLFNIWIVAMLNNAYAHWLVKRTGIVHGEFVSTEVLLMAGLVFVIAQVFKRGVELQAENDLTV